MPISDALRLFSSFYSRWYFGGGIALELFTGRSWRGHDDLDIGVMRSDLEAISTIFVDWDIQVATAGVLRPWDGGALSSESDENNLWIRRDKSGPWRLDIQIGDGNAERWIYRRDPSITLPWDVAINTALDGAPYLAPEVQLLFKSKNFRQKDDFDAREVIPDLDELQKAWLIRFLPAHHEWRRYFELDSKT
jgi:hypothetical protein